MINQKLHVNLICISIILSVEGCSSVPPPSVEAIATQSTNIVSLTATNTLVAGVPTSINTSLPLIASFHTLSPDDAYARLQNVLKNNADCRLPCWWGITPGKTTWKEAEAYLGVFNDLGNVRGGVNEFSSVSVHLPLLKEEFTLNHTYYIKNNIVVGVGAYVYDWSPFLYLSNILTEYGPPDGVFLTTFRYELNGMRPYQVNLVYEKLGILLSYSGGDAKNIGDTVQNCFEDLDSPFVFIWFAEDEPLTSQEAINKYLKLQSMPYPISLEEAAGMDMNTFYETFKDPNSTNCLVTPAELWPEP